MKRLMIATVSAAVLSLSLPAFAQNDDDRRYERWRGGYETPEHTERLVEQLNDLIRQAERDRAASPGFLRDLREALQRHEAADNRLAQGAGRNGRAVTYPEIADDFSDGTFTADPAWTVAQGEWFVTRENQLASHVDVSRSATPEEGIKRLFEGLLGNNRGREGREGGRAVNVASSIFLTHDISNAFDLETRLFSGAEGLLEIGVYQGSDGRNGYRLQFSEEGWMRLVRVGSSIATLRQADFTFPAAVANSTRPEPYDVRWRRSENGRMQVWVDGVEKFNLIDNGFRDPFDGFRMVNANGRHGMDAVRIKLLE